MTTIDIPKPPIKEWDEYRLLADCYLDFMQAKVAIETRARLFKERVLIDMGLMEKIITEREADSEGKPRKFVKVEYAETDNEEDNKAIIEQCKKIEEELPEHSAPYASLLKTASEMQRYQKNTLAEIIEITKSEALAKWVERTKGLSDVAMMTFIGYINPAKVQHVKQVWKYFGLTKDSKLRAGEKVKFNTEIKGRMFLIARNLVMQKDPYYEQLYRMRKEYLMQCDEVNEEWLKKKGGKLRVDMNAKFWMVKLVVSHATQIILESNGKVFGNDVHENNGPYLPPRPEDMEDILKYLDAFRATLPEKIERRNRRYRESKANHESKL